MGSPETGDSHLVRYAVAEVQQALVLLPRDTYEQFLGLLAAGGALADAFIAAPDHGGGEKQEAHEEVMGSLLTSAAQRLGIENPDSEEAHAALRQRLANFGVAVTDVYPETKS